MSARFEELAWRPTPQGEISLRRRLDPVVGIDVYEVKLGEEFLMSSLFTVSERALARIGLAQVTGERLDVVVGGLGLGFTAHEVLADPRVASMIVVDAIPDVIQWHRDDLVPGGRELSHDPRTTLVEADFFALAESADGFDLDTPGRRFDAILVDIDHSPQHWLNEANGRFYSSEALTRLRAHLTDGGVFALWSDDDPDDGFLGTLRSVFDDAAAHPVEFPNPLTGGTSSASIYTGTRA